MGLNLVERLRAFDWRLGTAPDDSGPGVLHEGADEIERLWAHTNDLTQKLNEARGETACALDVLRKQDAEIGLLNERLTTAATDHTAEIARIKADNSDWPRWVSLGFRRGYHAAATEFSRLTFELARMTVPIGEAAVPLEKKDSTDGP